MSAGLLYLIGAIGFQIDDTLTTFFGVRLGVVEGNRLFKFLDNEVPNPTVIQKLE